MNAQLKAFLSAIVDAGQAPPRDIASFLRALPQSGALPPPWESWTLIGLVRHLKRQHWVVDIIRTRLRGNSEDLAAMSAFGHPEGVPQSGPVPGMSEWEYYFHGRGCCISHKVEGDEIDVDFYDDTGNYFDTHFYKNYLQSLRHPELPEQRLRELHPSARTITIPIPDLLAAGALMPLPGHESHPYRLADEVCATTEAIDAFCTAWADPERRIWLAAMIGDWLAADVAATGELTAITKPRAEQCRELRRKRLHKDHDKPYKGADALQALADLKSPDLDQCLETALSGPPTGTISAALEVITERNDAKWCASVYKLFSRVDPAGQVPEPHLWITSLTFLLNHGYKTAEVAGTLSKAGGAEIGEAVLVALEHAPAAALLLIRKALLADIPINRIQVAATLAIIAKPWAIRELLGALKASDDQEKTADARAALLESGDDEAQKEVLAWEERNPHENEMGSYLEIGGRELGLFYTFGELSLKGKASRIKYEMDKLYDRVMKLRNVVPPGMATQP